MMPFRAVPSLQRFFDRKLLLYVSAFLLILLSGCQVFQTEKEQVENIESNYHINVVYGDPSQIYSTLSNQDNSRRDSILLTPTPVAGTSETLKGLEEALSIYPENFVSSVIDSVYIAEHIIIDNAEAGGTFFPGWVVIENATELNGTGSNYNNALHALHHELASLVVARIPYFHVGWLQFFPQDWKSAGSNYAAINVDDNMEINFSDGFLTAYGTTSAGNDFSVYAEHAFIEPDKLCRLASEYPVISKKLGKLISAYESADPRFKKYFEETGLSAVATMNASQTFDIYPDISQLKPKITQGSR